VPWAGFEPTNQEKGRGSSFCHQLLYKTACSAGHLGTAMFEKFSKNLPKLHFLSDFRALWATNHVKCILTVDFQNGHHNSHQISRGTSYCYTDFSWGLSQAGSEKAPKKCFIALAIYGQIKVRFCAMFQFDQSFASISLKRRPRFRACLRETSGEVSIAVASASRNLMRIVVSILKIYS
jgi:hypothetical protein